MDNNIKLSFRVISRIIYMSGMEQTKVKVPFYYGVGDFKKGEIATNNTPLVRQIIIFIRTNLK